MKRALRRTVLLFFAAAYLAACELDLLRLLVVAVGSFIIVAPLVPELLRTLFIDEPTLWKRGD